MNTKHILKIVDAVRQEAQHQETEQQKVYNQYLNYLMKHRV